MDSLLTISQVAQHLGCSTKHVRRIINAGELAVIETGSTAKGDRITVKELETWITKKRKLKGVECYIEGKMQRANIVPFGGYKSKSVANALTDLRKLKTRKRPEK